MRNLPPGAKSLGIKLPPGIAKPRGRARPRQGVMNGTESTYAEHLETLRRAGEIVAWDFQPEKLLLARNIEIRDGKEVVRTIGFSPDFRVVERDLSITFVDVKGRSKGGPLIEDDAAAKIRVAAARHPYLFKIAWPRKGGGWDQITVEGREGT